MKDFTEPEMKIIRIALWAFERRQREMGQPGSDHPFGPDDRRRCLQNAREARTILNRIGDHDFGLRMGVRT